MDFVGTWKLDRSENYEKLLEKMGVDEEKRKLAAHDNMKLKIKQNGKQFSVHESSVFRTIDINFTVTELLQYSLADGLELVGAWKLNGDIMEGEFTRKDNKKVLKTTREIVGGELVQTNLYEGVEAKRIFKRE
ncbi:fatty acid-binding protein, intestinal-like isoform X3 [Microcaecilia unicolor]|uniref:Fatty acid-binding protein, intestinal-like isoform X3 n=1 Tax=Microcaecilia unicolor TaxID=1415580 RepID=A0A6P7XBW8_9AMPH|nr:fatty acid-binding protein, intestinal-like isoform X3 [Microcaecilia unicolor]